MKTIAAIIFAALIIPNVLFAAPSNETLPSPSNESRQAPPVPKDDEDSGYSPRAKNLYLGTAIGTLVAGGALVALGIGISNSNTIGGEAIGPFFSGIGGVSLAASTVLWILFFHEKGKEPPVAAAVELDKGKAVALATFSF